MRKKTDKLLQQVPDVSIRDRSEYDAEEEAEESDDHEEDDHKASRKVNDPEVFCMQKFNVSNTVSSSGSRCFKTLG